LTLPPAIEDEFLISELIADQLQELNLAVAGTATTVAQALHLIETVDAALLGTLAPNRRYGCKATSTFQNRGSPHTPARLDNGLGLFSTARFALSLALELRRRLSNQAVADGNCHRLRAIRGVQLAHRHGQVFISGSLGDRERLADLFRCLAGGSRFQRLELSPAQLMIVERHGHSSQCAAKTMARGVLRSLI
jgi:hypothetical protein